jgi:hypothetical protein
MTTHELARKLLEGPDLPAILYADSTDPYQYVDVETIEQIGVKQFRHGYLGKNVEPNAVRIS